MSIEWNDDDVGIGVVVDSGADVVVTITARLDVVVDSAMVVVVVASVVVGVAIVVVVLAVVAVVNVI